jgi:hypothetical protein
MNAVLPFEESLDVAVGEAVDESLAARWEDTTKLRSLLLLLQEAPQLRARWLEEAYGKRDRVAEVIATRTDTDPADLRNLIIAGAITLTVNTALQVWADQYDEPKVAPYVHRGLKELTTRLLPSHHFEDAWEAGSCSSMVQQSR